MAELCGPAEEWGEGHEAWGNRKAKDPQRRGGKRRKDVLISGQGSTARPSLGDPESGSYSSLSDRKFTNSRDTCLHQSGGSPGARKGSYIRLSTLRGQGAISSLRLRAHTRGSWGESLSLFPQHPTPTHEGPGAGGSARELLEFGGRLNS